MTLRRKFLSALVGLVVFLSLIFGGISLWSMQSLLGHAVQYIGQSYSRQWERLLTYYYEQNGSWNGVQGYVYKIIEEPHHDWLMSKDNEHLLLFDAEKRVVASFRPRDVGKTVAQLPQPIPKHLPQLWHAIQVNGKTVGYYWFDQMLIERDAFIAKRIAASIFRAMLVGLIVTSLAALVLGILLTRRLTGPLRRLTEAVKQVGQGDLTSRLEVQGNDDIALLTRAFNGMTERLARNEEARRNMVADIAHELRTPLAVILGKLESIQEGVLPSNPEVLLPIQDETLRLIRLVRDLQQLTLAEAGKLPLSLQEVDLKALLERILEQFAIEFQEREIKAGIEGEVPRISADPDRLTQVFVNLVGNALLHTPAGGSIHLHLSTAPVLAGEENRNPKGDTEKREWVKIEVGDTGVGIPGQELDHIFDRFYRVDKSRERETGHTGLGLAIAREFVQAHGGLVQVESRLKEGTTFTVWLPRDISQTNCDPDANNERRSKRG